MKHPHLVSAGEYLEGASVRIILKYAENTSAVWKSRPLGRGESETGPMLPVMQNSVIKLQCV